ncbi:hypothetical protein B0H15DRAFT_59276 [Mycena belliarum]|uniref:Uncharacterized protein n=1 Tax=Mycena belliarum TaxID=1033014 RepID=A0AAD6XH30_9AGAR|nr:hypothetical protein B0H15DRAFT_59276 [Mycena belliae]
MRGDYTYGRVHVRRMHCFALARGSARWYRDSAHPRPGSSGAAPSNKGRRHLARLATDAPSLSHPFIGSICVALAPAPVRQANGSSRSGRVGDSLQYKPEVMRGIYGAACTTSGRVRAAIGSAALSGETREGGTMPWRYGRVHARRMHCCTLALGRGSARCPFRNLPIYQALSMCSPTDAALSDSRLPLYRPRYKDAPSSGLAGPGR